MAKVFLVEKTITTDANGDATEYIRDCDGFIHFVQYVKTDYATGVDFVITLDTIGENVWNESNVDASKIVYPKVQNHDTVGAAITGEYDRIYMGSDHLKIVVSNGGANKTGIFRAMIVDE